MTTTGMTTALHSTRESAQRNNRKETTMKRRIILFALILTATLCVGQARAQLAVPFGHYLLPTKPTSADNLTLSMSRVCGGYKANAYSVNMSQNNITVTRGEVGPFIGPGGGCTSPPNPRV